jgi:p-methyltransferase
MRFLLLLRRAPLAVGISTVAITYPETVAEIVSVIRRHSPNSIIILGGRGAGRSAAMRKQVDITIIDYGENALVRLLSALKKGMDIDSIPGVERDEDGARVMRGDAYYETGGKILFPDWRFSNSLVKMFPVEGSRGCEHNCSFCMLPNKKKQVFRTPSDVFNEVVNDVRVHGARDISFVDSSFTSDHEFITEFLGLLISAKLWISWICFSRVDDFALQPGIAERMDAAGCRLSFMGIESIHDDILARMRKGYDRKTVEEALSRLDGLNVLANFIIGFPGDTEAKVRETVDFIERSTLRHVSIKPLYVPPGLFEEARLDPSMFCHLRGEAGDVWEHDTMNYAQAAELAKWARRRLNRWKMLPMAI